MTTKRKCTVECVPVKQLRKQMVNRTVVSLNLLLTAENKPHKLINTYCTKS